MNQCFFPNTEKNAKPGIVRHHKLIETSEKTTEADKNRDAMPTSWMYNQSRTQQLWNELEEMDMKIQEIKRPEENPFQKIDDATTRIKKAITNFEVSDQEFILDLMELMGDDSYVDTIDGGSLLMEARSHLQAMIDDHVNLSERQEMLLTGMKSWFQGMKDHPIEAESQTEKFLMNHEHIQELKEMLDEHSRQRGDCLERVENLHQDMLQTLHNKVHDCQKVISQKDLELNQITQSKDMSRRRTSQLRAGRLSISRDSPDYSDELAKSQRQVMELQNQVLRLRATLADISATPDYTKNDQLSSREEAAVTQRSIRSLESVSQHMDQMSAGDEDVSISIQKEIEFDAKLRVLQDQILNLKDDNAYLRDQIVKQKQNELVLEKRFQSLDRSKKSAEESLQAANQRMNLMKETYEKQLSDLKQATGAFADEGLASVDVTKKYEAKIANMEENFRKQLSDSQEALDRKYKAQIRDMIASCGQGEVLKAFDESTRQFNQQIQELKYANELALKGQKQNAAQQVMEISRHYEVLLKKKDFDMDRVRDSVDCEVRNRALEMKIEYEEKMNIKVLQAQESLSSDFATVKHNLTSKIQELKGKLTDVTRERDTLKSLIDVDDDAVDLVGEVVLESEISEDDQTQDDILQQSLAALREKEIEQKLSEKSALMLKAQKEMLADSTSWEIDQAKQFYQRKYDLALNNFRRDMAKKIHKVYDTCPEDSHELRTLLTETLEMLSAKSDEVKDAIGAPAIPLYEVDAKLNASTQKIIDILDDKRIWTNAFKELGDLDGKTETDILDSVKHALTAEAEQFDLIQKENAELRGKLRIISSTTNRSQLVLDEVLDKIDEEETADVVPKAVLDSINAVDTDEHVSCFHCQHNYIPLIVSKQISEIQVCRCPECNHLTMLKQSSSIDDLSNISEEAVPAQLPETEQVVTERVVKEVVRVENPADEQLRKELEDSMEANRKLKKKLELSTKHMTDVESEYLKKIDSMANEIAKLKQAFLSESIDVIKGARSLPSLPENLESKVRTTVEITRNMQELQSMEPQTKESIRKLNDAISNLSTLDSCDAVNQVLDQTHEVLQMISKDQSNEQATLNASLLLKQHRIRLDVARADVSTMKDEVEELKRAMQSFMARQQNMIKQMGSASQQVVQMANNVKKSADKQITDLNNVLNARTEALDISQRTVAQQREVIDDLQRNLKSSVMHIEKLTIEKGLGTDDVYVFKKMLNQSNIQIDKLSTEVIEANDRVRNLLREADEMKIAYESQKNFELVMSARSGSTGYDDIQMMQPIPELEYVPPFILFTNSTSLPDTPRRGFSLMPRNSVLSQSSCSSSIETPMEHEPVKLTLSPSDSARVIDIPARPSKIRIAGFETAHKPRLEIAESAPRSRSGSPPPEMPPLHSTPVTPKSPKSPKVMLKPQSNQVAQQQEKIRLRIGGAQKIARPGTAAAKVVVPKSSSKRRADSAKDQKEDPSRIPRTMSFENLVPISETEVQGTLIGYVTHYVSEPPSDYANMPRPQRGPHAALRPSPVLISEVPLEQLRVDDNTPSDIPKQPPSAAQGEWIQAFERRIKSMEKLLHENNDTLQKERDRSNVVTQRNLILRTELAKANRAGKKSELLHDATKKRLAQALSLINENDLEISRLRKMLKEIGVVADAIMLREKMQKRSDLEKTYNNESSKILRVFRGVSAGIHGMAEHEIQAVRKWVPKREQYVVEEREKLLASLRAMQLVSGEQQEVKPVIISSTKTKKEEKKRPTTAIVKNRAKDEVHPTFEQATIAASAHNQKLPRTLREGVVGSSRK